MRHKCANRKLGRPTDERIALLKNQVTKLFLHGKITTTESKAKETKKLAEKTLTSAKPNDLSAKKAVRQIVNDKEAFRKVFEEYVPKYKDRQGGCISMVKLPPRRGDGVDMALLVFVD